MDTAVARVKQALEGREHIAVFGDYDVDGSVSTALLADFLTALGSPPRLYIPDRMREGYGPSAPAMRTLQAEGASLVITVDCGAAGGAAFEAARDVGLDVVVLDHHRVETRPDALAHVNPNQPGDRSGLDLSLRCGRDVSVPGRAQSRPARKRLLCCAWHRRTGSARTSRSGRACDGLRCGAAGGRQPRFCASRVGAAVQTVAAWPGGTGGDRQSRAAFHRLSSGICIRAAHQCRRPGGPLDAGRRSSDRARRPKRRRISPLQLDLHNRERQGIEKLILEEAVAFAATQDNVPFLLVSNDGWHPGVVGIVAGPAERAFRQARLLSRGSKAAWAAVRRVRSPASISARMVRAAREQGLIEAGGGHAMAAGFSLMAKSAFGLPQFLEKQFAGTEAAYEEASAWSWTRCLRRRRDGGLVAEIALAGPYGAGNPEPLLGFPDVRVAFADVVGGAHVKSGWRAGTVPGWTPSPSAPSAAPWARAY